MSSITLRGPDGVDNGFAIKSRDGANFALKSFQLGDWGYWEPTSYTVEAFDDGVSMGSQEFVLDQAYFYEYFTLTLDPVFGNVDEVRIHRTDGKQSWLGINNVVIDDPVAGTPAGGSHIIDFNTDDYADLGTTPTDGTGGSTDIPGQTFEFVLMDADLNPTGDTWIYWSDLFPTQPGAEDGIAPSSQSAPVYVIRKTDGTEFSFQGINVNDLLVGQPNVRFEAFRDGVSLGAVTLGINRTTYGETFSYDNGLTPSIFQNVDEIRITNPDGLNWLYIDDIVVGPPTSTVDYNDAPVVTVPADQTVAEDTTLSFTGARLLTIEDPDDNGAILRAELRVDNGTLMVTNTSGVTGNNSGFLTIEGTEAHINSVLTGLSYRGTLNFNGSDSLEVQVFDNGNTGDRPGSVDGSAGAGYEDGSSNKLVTTRTIPITVTPVNDAPVFGSLAGPITYTENGAGVALDADATISDIELSGRVGGNGDWNGAMLTVARYSGGTFSPNASDIFEATGTLAFVPTGGGAGDVVVGGTIVGTYAFPTDGRLEITFNGAATNAMVSSVLRQITYRHDGDAPPPSLTLRVQIDDANTGIADQGSGGNKMATYNLAVTVARANDAPGIAGLDARPTYSEDSPSVVLDGSVDMFDAELDAANNWSGATLTLRRDGGANAEDVFEGSGTLTLSGGNVVLAGTTVGSYTMSGGQITIHFNSQATSARVDAVAQQLAYRNTSQNPPASVDIAWIVNDGGNTSSQGGAAQTNPAATTTVDIAPVNDAPTLTGLPTSASYAEGAAPTRIAPAVTLGDVDSPDFNGGSLTSGGEAADRLSIQNQGTGAGQIGFDDTTVTYGGVEIGTVSGGDGTNPLVVTFTSAAATRAAVEALIENLTFASTSEHPDIAARTARLTLVDGDGTAPGGTDTYVSPDIILTVSRANDAPALSGLSGSVDHTEGGAATVLAPGATLSDAELDLRGHWAGATLTLERQGGADANDVFVGSGALSLTPAGDVVLAGVTVGTWSAATAGRLAITFSANATPALVDQVAQSIVYRHTGDTPPASVVIGWTISDGNTGVSDQGASGMPLTGTGAVTVNLTATNDAPVLADTALSMSVDENAGAPVAGVAAGILVSDLVGGITDPDLTPGRGIAIVGADSSNGTWWFSTDGGASWWALGTLSESAARLLAADANTRLHFAPNADYNGTAPAGLTIRAWDMFLGSSGVTIDVSANGGTTPISAQTDTVTVTVVGVNDAPTATNLTQSKSFTEDGGAIALDDIVVTDADTGDTITATLTLSHPAAGTLSVGTYGSATSTYDVATGIWTVTGSVADVNAALAAVTFAPASNWTQSVTISTHIRDAAGTGPADGTITLTATPVNDAPVATAPSSISVTEDTPTALTGISFADIDAGPGSVTVTLSVPAGSLAATSGGGVIVGGTASALTLSGTLADINAFIAASSVTYTPASNDSGTRVLTVSINDGGNSGSGGAQSDTVTVSLNVLPLNDAPVATVPGNISAREDVQTALTGISLVDIDAGAGSVTVTLSVPAGSLSATSGAGVTVGGTASALTLTGTVADINAFIAASGVGFQPPAGESGTFKVSVSVDDGGNTGAGGALTDAAEFDVVVAPVNDAPQTQDVPLTVLEDGSHTFRVEDFAFSDTDDGAAPNQLKAIIIEGLPGQGVLSFDSQDVTNGDLPLVIEVADIGKLVFTPDGDANGASYAEIAFRVQDDGGTANGGEDTSASQTIRIDVTPVNDAPTIGGLQPTQTIDDKDQMTPFGDIVIGDVDGPATVLTATFTLDKAGTGTLSNLGGFELNDNGSYSLTGTASEVQAALRGIVFRPLEDLARAGQTVTTGISLTVTDGQFSDTQDTSVEVISINDGPVGGGDGPVEVNEGATVTATSLTGVLGNYDDPEVDDLTVTGVSFNGVDGAIGEDIAGAYGTLILNADGSYSYVADQDAADALAGGETHTDVFTYTISDGNGATTTATLTFQVNGVNDEAAISGDDAGTVTEDGTLAASGILTVQDVDTGEAAFEPQDDVQGAYGTFSFDAATGEWTYLLDNEAGAVQAIRENETRQETFTVKAKDGTEHTITVTINGTQDAEWIDGVAVIRSTSDNGDGTQSQVVEIPVVTPERSEQVGNNTVADIPLVASGGRTLLSVQVPGGIGLLVTGLTAPKAAGTSLTDLIREIQAHTAPGSTDQDQLTGGGSGFLSGLPADAPLLVQTIVLSGGGSSSQPLVISGTPAAPGEPQTALVIDARGVPAGTVIELHNVDFATVIGDVRVTGGTGNQVVWGDSADQTMVLGEGDDVLHGGAGDDYVGSYSGNDWLHGDEGNDTVNGGSGHDHLYGGTGVDSLIGSSGSDTLFGGSGKDVLKGGTGTDKLYGESGSDRLYGNTGRDYLKGGSGADKLYGGSANDRLYGDTGSDRLSGGTGHDKLRGGEGNDVLLGGSGNDGLRGNEGRDKLYGGSGHDTINGGAGNDDLYGGSGDDVFLFNSELGKGNFDTIKDFAKGDDRIVLEDSIFARTNGRDTLDFDLFRVGSQALDADDRIIYDQASGKLFYDVDGAGGQDQVQFARIDKWLNLTHDDFRIL